MTICALSPNISVSPQISAKDVAAAADLGFRAVICNRPDGEEPGQPEWAEIKAAAREAALETAHIPITGKEFPPASVASFAEAVEAMPKPILAYCRSGARSTILWALSNNGSLTADERIRAAARAGHDLEPYRKRMENGA